MSQTPNRRADPSPLLDGYTSLVIGVGAVLLARNFPSIISANPRWFIVLLVLGVAASVFKLNLQLPGGGATMTFGYVVGFMGLLELGPHPTAIIIGTGIWIQCTFRPERRTAIDLRRALFSTAVGVITVEAAGAVFEMLPGSNVAGRGFGDLWTALSVAALVYFVVNTVLVASAIALTSRQPLTTVWHRNFLWSGPSYFVSALIVAAGSEVIRRQAYVAVAVSMFALVITYRAYKVYLDRVAEERRQLKIARDYTNSIIHSMNEMLFVVTTDGVIKTTNRTACRLLGYEEAELEGKPLHSLLVGAGPQLVAPIVRDIECRLRMCNGAELPVLFSASPLAVGAHGAEGTVCVALDIRERVQAERERLRHQERLRRREAALASLAREESLQAGEFSEAAQRLTETAARLLDVSRVDLWMVGGNWSLRSVDSFELASELHSKRESSGLGSVPSLANALYNERVIVLTGTDAEDRPDLAAWRLGAGAVSILLAPVRLGVDTVAVFALAHPDADRIWSIDEQQFAGSLADLASLAVVSRNRRIVLDELKRAKDAAEAANAAKSAFVASMSHELRTPLNAIIGYSEMLLEDAADSGRETDVGDLEKITKAGKHLLGLIDDVLDFSKLEAGRMQLMPESFATATLVREAADTIRPLVAKNNNTLTLDVPEDAGTTFADPQRVRQIVLNLLSNACKFTHDGQVTVRAFRQELGTTQWTVIEISDTGIGMSPDQVERLFQEFVQADSSTTRRFGGTGLGLAISQRFCRLMGGGIEVRSELGFGSTFIVRLPSDAARALEAAFGSPLAASA